MQSQIIENWSLISGKINEIQPTSELDGFGKLRMSVTAIKRVASFPELISPRKMTTYWLYVRNEDLGSVHVGQSIEATVRLAPPDKLFVRPGSLHTK